MSTFERAVMCTLQALISRGSPLTTLYSLYVILPAHAPIREADRVARRASSSSACFLMLPETSAAVAVRDALESVANDLGASTFQGPPNELLVQFARRFAESGRANLLVVDISAQCPEFVEAARVAQAFGT